MTTPDKVFGDATEALHDRDTHAVLPPRHRISPHVIAQPLDGTGSVYGQVGWLDDHGTTYGLRLPDGMCRDGTGLRPLYVWLGRRDGWVDETEPPE